MGRSEANPTVGSIEHGVEALEECVTNDEIKTRSRSATSAFTSINEMGKDNIPMGNAKIIDDEVNIAIGTINLGVK